MKRNYSKAGQHLALLVALAVFQPTILAAERLPVIDMHLHALAADGQGPPPLAMCTPMEMPHWDQRGPYQATFLHQFKNPTCKDPVWSPESDVDVRNQTLAALNEFNVIGVVSGSAEMVAQWRKIAPERIIPGLSFNVARMPDFTPERLREMVASDQLRVLAEITNQYAGIMPDDESMAPYWKMAEELMLPVGIHVGPGPPGVIYLESSGYRARMHSALTLENVLVKHPGLRLYIMHAGYPMLDDLLAVLHAHPQVYAEVGIIVYTVPRAGFYRFVQGIFDAGFGKRLMFGSDQMVWPGVIERSIKVIEEAPFLSESQKRDVLYHNAARFLRLSEKQIKRHHEM